MSLLDVFGLHPMPSIGEARRVEPLGAWPEPRPMTPGRMAQIQGLIARNVASGKERGARNGHSKLTDEAVLKIRAMRASGERQTVIAERFDIDRTLVWKITSRKVWTHI